MASVNFNMSNNNSGFGDINNCNSLNSSVVSSPTVNSIRMNSFYKFTNVLLLLFLVFVSSVVSFGMENQQPQIQENNMNESIEKLEKNDMNENKENEKQQQGQFGSPMLHPPPKVDGPVDIAPRDRYLRVPSIINKISMLFLTKVMDVKWDGMKDQIDNARGLFFLFSLLGLSDIHLCYGRNNRGVLLISYFIGNILAHSLYRGLFSVKPCFKKIKEGGNCELYFGIGNVPYVGGLFNLSLVCKPTFILKYLPLSLKDKVTIHIIDIKPFNFILGLVGYILLILHEDNDNIYIRPQWIVGFGTVEINIAKYYNISLNFGSWIVDLITFMKYTKKANKNEIKKDNEPQDDIFG